MLEKAPDTVLVHFVADAEVIAERMRADPSEHVSASGGQIMPQVVRAHSLLAPRLSVPRSKANPRICPSISFLRVAL